MQLKFLTFLEHHKKIKQIFQNELVNSSSLPVTGFVWAVLVSHFFKSF